MQIPTVCPCSDKTELSRFKPSWLHHIDWEPWNSQVRRANWVPGGEGACGLNNDLTVTLYVNCTVHSSNINTKNILYYYSRGPPQLIHDVCCKWQNDTVWENNKICCCTPSFFTFTTGGTLGGGRDSQVVDCSVHYLSLYFNISAPIHAPQMINPAHFGDPLTFHLVPHSGLNFV